MKNKFHVGIDINMKNVYIKTYCPTGHTTAQLTQSQTYNEVRT